jgi:hypothetical protein
MKATITIVSVLCPAFAGCSVTQEVEQPATQLELLDMTPLPALQLSSFPGG